MISRVDKSDKNYNLYVIYETMDGSSLNLGLYKIISFLLITKKIVKVIVFNNYKHYIIFLK